MKIIYYLLAFYLFASTATFGKTIYLKSKVKTNFDHYYAVDSAASQIYLDAIKSKPEGCGGYKFAKIVSRYFQQY